MKKILMLIIMVIGIMSNLAAEWDQSLSRWESDCSYDMDIGCSIAGSMYEDGHNVTYNGEHNVETTMKKNPNKALKLYKKGCGLGGETSCEKYKTLSKKLGLSVAPEKPSDSQDNYRVYAENGNTVYEISAANPCRITFGKNTQMVKNGCKKLTNSKGINIYCSQSKTVCKTESEIRQTIQ